ncbi:hypothetical protein [Evansella cellulosilytica]|uniref:Uncharacterized protein n=1 Tax=Evansella cellulosilytica (strain ATCC 21833 / DSM 2522 / FERM P-1141 / JCM 9156 / N-4) TaxID=649639 RepID=E6TY60_EVAC2|nr:hypothetical protein [Evansella cellulosilytica]ADU32379.1 hypothetical protein Bcell_4152 [Evansella cellulosilytica DSM 2522]
MVGRTRLISDKYFRYIVSWLIFGVLGGTLFWQIGWMYTIASVAIAFMLSFGIDMIARMIVGFKVRSIVNEKPLLTVEAIRLRMEKKGFLVVTNRFILFVPLFRKIKTVIDTNQIVRYEVDRLQVTITARLPNRYRTFSYNVTSTKAILSLLQEMTGESLPYKYEKMEKDTM